MIAECMDFDWKKLDIRTLQRFWEELLNVYPVHFREIKYFHTGLAANLAAALTKRFLSRETSRVFNLGCQFEGRLDTYYMIPTPEIANERIIGEMECFLRIRFDNERNFKL